MVGAVNEPEEADDPEEAASDSDGAVSVGEVGSDHDGVTDDGDEFGIDADLLHQ